MLVFLACRGELLRRNQHRGLCAVVVAVAAAAVATAALALQAEAFPLIPAGRSMAAFSALGHLCGLTQAVRNSLWAWNAAWFSCLSNVAVVKLSTCTSRGQAFVCSA